MEHLDQHFWRSIRWNTLESCVFHGIFLLHQCGLYAITPRPMYGLIGLIFSLIFIAASLINLGLDASLAPLFVRLTRNRAVFKKFMAIQLVPNGIGSLIIIAITWHFRQAISNFGCTPVMFGIIASIIVLESLKKTLRTILQLALLPHIPAVIEVATILSYAALVWGWYLFAHSVHLYTVFAPMLVVSFLGTAILFWYTYQWYCRLPSPAAKAHTAKTHVVKNRVTNTIHQVTLLLFSANFLVPLFAFRFGLEYAGLLKIISYTSHSITSIAQKIFGTASNILLSNIKNSHLAAKRKLFLTITNPLNQILYCIIIFFIINHKVILATHTMLNIEPHLTMALWCLAINLLPTFFIAYEKFFIIEEEARYLVLVNGIALVLVYLLLAMSSCSPLAIIFFVCTIRSIGLLLLGVISLYKWQLQATWKMQPHYFIGTLFISLIFFFIAS